MPSAQAYIVYVMVKLANSEQLSRQGKRHYPVDLNNILMIPVHIVPGTVSWYGADLSYCSEISPSEWWRTIFLFWSTGLYLGWLYFKVARELASTTEMFFIDKRAMKCNTVAKRVLQHGTSLEQFTNFLFIPSLKLSKLKLDTENKFPDWKKLR